MSGGARLEAIVGRVLRIGVTASSACLAVGLGLSMLAGAGAPANILLHTGLIVLMATPVTRVVVSVGQYAVDRDWLFASLTLTVLVVLLASLAVAVR